MLDMCAHARPLEVVEKDLLHLAQRVWKLENKSHLVKDLQNIQLELVGSWHWELLRYDCTPLSSSEFDKLKKDLLGDFR